MTAAIADDRASTHPPSPQSDTAVVIARGPYSLAASAHFLEGFVPAAHPGATEEGHLHLAFPTSTTWTPVGVCVRPHVNGVEVVVPGASGHARQDVCEDVARILSLDVDGAGFARIGVSDPIIGRLQDQAPGLRPVCFHTPYEAACWAIIGQRIRMSQAAAVRHRLATVHGTVHTVCGQQVSAFPTPTVLLELLEDLDLPAVKRRRLGVVARAALRGELDPRLLRQRAPDDALAALQELEGIGPFSAELVLLRGAGAPDVAPTRERRLRTAAGHLYDVDPRAEATWRRITDQWRPYRTWCAVLVRAWWEQSGRR